MDISPDGLFLAAGADLPPGEGGLMMFDARTFEFLWTCADIPSTPWQFRFTADGRSVWTARYYGGHVSRIDTDTCQIVESFDVGSWPVDVMFDASRRFLFVGEDHPGGTYSTQGSIQIIDTWTHEHVGGINLHGRPGHMTMSPHGRYLFTISANMASGTEKLYRIDTVDWSVSSVIDVPDTGANCGMSVSRDGSTLYVPRRHDHEILVIDAESMTIDRAIPVPAPWSVSIAPSGDHAIVLHDGLPSISVLDLESESVVQLIPLNQGSSDWKRDVSWTNDGHRAVIAHSSEVIVLESCLSADVTQDGFVTIDDLVKVVLAWGCPAL